MLRTSAYRLFVLVGFAQLGSLLVIGDSTISGKGVVIVCARVIWLGRGSRAAWWVFIVGNAAQLVVALPLVFASSSGGSLGTGTDWGDAITIIGGSSALLVILLSSEMRAARYEKGLPSRRQDSAPA